MKAIGVEKANFTGRDGNVIQGYKIHFTRPISAEHGKGQSIVRDGVFVTDSKAKAMNIDVLSLVGHDVEVFYTKQGRLASISLKN